MKFASRDQTTYLFSPTCVFVKTVVSLFSQLLSNQSNGNNMRRSTSYNEVSAANMIVSEKRSKSMAYKNVTSKRSKSQATSEKKRKENVKHEAPESGVTQMTSLVISFLFSPLWSIGARDADTQRCLDEVDWVSEKVKNFVRLLDETRDSVPNVFARIFHILEGHPQLNTAFIVLNMARVEHIEMNKLDVPSYSWLLVKEQDRKKQEQKLKGKTERNYTISSDEIFATRSLTEMGGEALELIKAKPKAKFLEDYNLKLVRRHLLQIILLAACFCKYNYRDDNLYRICDQVCTQMFLISPHEVLSTLCCGEKGPVYISKYLRFLMTSTGPLLVESDHYLPSKVVRCAAYGVPGAVQDAWLPLFVSLLNLAHSANEKSGQNICAAFTLALRHQLERIDTLEKKINDLETIYGTVMVGHCLKPSEPETAKKPDGKLDSALATVKNLKNLTGGLLSIPQGLGLPDANSKKKDEEKDKKTIRQEISQYRDKIINLQRPLPSLLSLIRIFLCRIHCHGDDGPRAWGELIEVVRKLQILPGRSGTIAVDIMRAAAGAVQCYDCLLRHRLSKCFIGGGMTAFKRQRAYIFLNTHSKKSRAVNRLFLGKVPWAKGSCGTLLHLPIQKHRDPKFSAAAFDDKPHHRNTQQLSILKHWTDDVLAPAGLVLNLFMRIAHQEEFGKHNPELVVSPPLDGAEIRNNLAQLPPTVLAQFLPDVYKLLRGPVGCVGRLITFSEGAGKTLKVVPELYKKLAEMYKLMIDGSGHHRHEDLMYLHTSSPVNPMLDVVLRLLPQDQSENNNARECPGNDWAHHLKQLVQDERTYYQGEPDYWGERTPDQEPYEIKLVLAGGSETILRYCNGLTTLSASGKLRKMPHFKLYPIPLGSNNLLANWISKQDPVYHQLINWPLHQTAIIEGSRMSENDLSERLLSKCDAQLPESLESGLLRTALDTYLVDADKCNKVYIYKIECWKRPPMFLREDKKSKDVLPDLVLSWCQQVEIIGPMGRGTEGAQHSTPKPGFIPPSPSTGSFGDRDGPVGSFIDGNSPSGYRNQTPGRKTRGSSITRNRAGSQTSRSTDTTLKLEITPTIAKTPEEMMNFITKEGGAFFLFAENGYDKHLSGEAPSGSRLATGSRICKWVSETFEVRSTPDIIRISQQLLDFNVIRSQQGVQRGAIFRESEIYKLHNASHPALQTPSQSTIKPDYVCVSCIFISFSFNTKLLI